MRTLEKRWDLNTVRLEHKLHQIPPIATPKARVGTCWRLSPGHMWRGEVDLASNGFGSSTCPPGWNDVQERARQQAVMHCCLRIAEYFEFQIGFPFEMYFEARVPNANCFEMCHSKPTGT